MDRVVGELRGCSSGLLMNVVPLEHIFRTIQNLVSSTRVLLASAALVGLLAAGAGISTTLLMAVAERTREIGVMRAVGASRADIFKLFLYESVQQCLAGAAAGIVLSNLASGLLEKSLRAHIAYAPVSSLVHWDWSLVGLCMALAFAVGTLAAWLPAWRAAHLPPIQAIRGKGGWF